MPELKAWQFAGRHAARLAKLTTWQLTAGAATVGLALAAGSAVAAGPWDSSGQRTAERDWAAAREGGGGTDHGSAVSGKDRNDRKDRKAPEAAPSAPSVLAALGARTDSVQAPAERALADVLDPLLTDGSLGSQRTAAVVDAATGKQVFGKAAGTAVTPASTTKIATAVAVLSAAGADHRIATRTVIEPGAKVAVLIGGGDPTLTARKDEGGTSLLVGVPPLERSREWGRSRELGGGSASLSTLADGTARALKKRGVDEISLRYDTSLYSGPTLHPIGPNWNIAPVTALMVDEGRHGGTSQAFSTGGDSGSGPAPRSGDPAADAARTFAELLRDRGIRTTTADPSPAKATDRAEPLASVQSPPLSALVERMLTYSDNDIAEALARQAALASGEPASFDGAAKAIRKQLNKLGFPLAGAQFADGSGLDRTDRLTANLLTALLARAADPAHAELRPVLTGLPVAGFTGTLGNRYADGPGTGLVRAKTGTLTGVNTLAGTVVDADGRLLVFAFMASGTTNPKESQSTLDRAASSLAACGCR